MLSTLLLPQTGSRNGSVSNLRQPRLPAYSHPDNSGAADATTHSYAHPYRDRRCTLLADLLVEFQHDIRHLDVLLVHILARDF